MARNIILLILLQCALFYAGTIDFRRAGAVIPSGAGNCNLTTTSPNLLHLKASFSMDGPRRACWDMPLKADLTHTAGVRIRCRWRNVHLASTVTVHLKLDDCWYSAELHSKGDDTWEEIYISKCAFRPENDRIASWKQCDKFRIAAWRGAAGTLDCLISEISFILSESSIALLRCGMTPGVDAKTRTENLRYCQEISDTLQTGGIYPAVIDECDAVYSTMDRYRFFVVPYMKGSSVGTQERLIKYVRNGGRLMLFHDIPYALRQAMRLPECRYLSASGLGRPVTKVQTTGGASFQQTPMAITTPVRNGAQSDSKILAWWIDDQGTRTNHPALLQTPYGLWMSAVFKNHDTRHAVAVLAGIMDNFVPKLCDNAAKEILRRSQFLINNAPLDDKRRSASIYVTKAENCRQLRDYPGVLDAAWRMENALIDGVSSPNQPSATSLSIRKDEMRGAWLRNSLGINGAGWTQTVRRAENLDLNALFPVMVTPFYAAFANPELPTRGYLKFPHDPLSDCIRQCHARKIQVHAWCQILCLADAPQEIQKWYGTRGRLQHRISGEEIPWLCPSDERNIALMRSVISAMVKQYPSLDGVNLDMVRYEGSTCCYCKNCLVGFKQFLGKTPQNWPKSTCIGQPLHSQWVAFRQQQVTHLISELTRIARATNPHIVISAAVYPDWNNAKEAVGQDWRQWLLQKQIDFVAPMDYQREVNAFRGVIQRQGTLLGPLAKQKLFPAIGWTTIPLDDMALKRQINAVRNANLPGFILFELKK